MKLITGLGNPGIKYRKTRHNAGFHFLDVLREKFLFQKGYTVTEWEEEKMFFSQLSFIKKGSKIVAILQKPHTFMNNSGLAVAKIAKKYEIDVEKNLILVHDDLDIKIGKFKMQYDRAPQGHNGVKDVEDRLKTKEFLRVRIGIESRIDKCISGEDFVLMKFTEDEQMVLNEVIEDSVTALLPEILL